MEKEFAGMVEEARKLLDKGLDDMAQKWVDGPLKKALGTRMNASLDGEVKRAIEDMGLIF